MEAGEQNNKASRLLPWQGQEQMLSRKKKSTDIAVAINRNKNCHCCHDQGERTKEAGGKPQSC